MDKITPKQINEIKRILGKTLCQHGESFSRDAFKIKPKVFDSRDVRNFIRKLTGLSAAEIRLADKKYYTVDWQTWLAIIKWDWVNEKKWLSDKWDCDNFANYFSSRVAYLFHLNSCGSVSGNIKDANTDEMIGPHRFNMIVTNDWELYLYEPMIDFYCKIKKGEKGVCGIWRYYPTYFRLN